MTKWGAGGPRHRVPYFALGALSATAGFFALPSATYQQQLGFVQIPMMMMMMLVVMMLMMLMMMMMVMMLMMTPCLANHE